MTNNAVQMHVLVIDDDPDILNSVGIFLEDQGHRVRLCDHGLKGLACLKKEVFDIVITDVKMPDTDGFEILKAVKTETPDTEVIMITAFRDLENVQRALRDGAFDFFAKPFRGEELDAALRRTVRFQTLRRERDRMSARLAQIDTQAKQQYGLSAIVGESDGIEQVRNMIAQVAQSNQMAVLVQGETGTGKELVAQAIHYESARADGPFVAVDCSAMPESLIESELFGYHKGAFTDAKESRKGYFEQAQGGTLFLDEIGNMDLAMQARLLRTLETRRVRPLGGDREIDVDVRVLSATNQDLDQALAEGQFRRDLYYRLNALTIHIPPLRERSEDIVPLAHHFLKRYMRELHKPIQGFSTEATVRLQGHAFPGNVRELRNLIERAVLFCQSDKISQADLHFDVQMASPAPAEHDLPGLLTIVKSLNTENLNLDAFDAALIREALQRFEGNQVQAAQALGISRDALIRRMKRFGILRDDFVTSESQ